MQRVNRNFFYKYSEPFSGALDFVHPRQLAATPLITITPPPLEKRLGTFLRCFFHNREPDPWPITCFLKDYSQLKPASQTDVQTDRRKSNLHSEALTT